MPNFISLKFFLEVVSSGKISQHKFTSTISASVKTKILFITKEPNIKREININYVLAGGGIVIALLLFVIVHQYVSKRSKPTNTKSLKQKTCEEIRTSDELVDNIQHVNEFSSNTIFHETNINNSNDTSEADYHDINEFAELGSSAMCSNASEEYIIQRLLLMPKHTYSPLTKGGNFLFNQLDDQEDQPYMGHSDDNKSDLYLQPITIRESVNVANWN